MKSYGKANHTTEKNSKVKNILNANVIYKYKNAKRAHTQNIIQFDASIFDSENKIYCTLNDCLHCEI